MRRLVFLLGLPLLALDNGVTVYEAAGVAQAERPITILRVFQRGEMRSGLYPKPRIGGVAPATWQVDVKSAWPDGSVMTAYVSFPVTLAANGSVRVDFVPDGNACHLGGAAVCQAAAMGQAAMGSFSSWDGTITGTANSITYSASARAMIAAGAWRYWLQGPVVTRVIVEDMTTALAYDFGWTYTGGAWQAPTNASYRSAHPMFEVSFYAGYAAGVEIGYRLENMWMTKLQRLEFTLSFGTEAGVFYMKTNYDLAPKAAVTHHGWSGTAPGEVVVDHNLEYLVATRVIPSLDPRIEVPSSVTDGMKTNFDAQLGTDDFGAGDPRSCGSQTYCGLWLMYMPNTGDHLDFEILSKWYASYLYAMGSSGHTTAQKLANYKKLVVGPGEAAVTVPAQMRESYTTLGLFNPADDASTPAFGRVVSLAAHPAGRFRNGYDYFGSTPVVYVCNSAPCQAADSTHGWTVDSAHYPSLFAVPYLLTGRYTFLASQLASAAVYIGQDHPDYGRNQGEGVQYNAYEARHGARALKDLFWAYLIAPDGPERVYFASKIKANDAFFEGLYGITDGLYASQNVADCRGAAITSDSMTWNSSSAPFRPDGVHREFALTTYRRFRSLTSVTVNGVAKTFGVYGVDTGKDWYYTPGMPWLRQDASGTVLTAADTLAVTFSSGRAANNYCFGKSQAAALNGNPIHMHGHGSATADTGHSSLGSESPWMAYGYQGLALGWFRQSRSLGVGSSYAFSRSAAEASKHVIEGVLHPDAPRYRVSMYRSPGAAGGATIQSWAEYASYYPNTLALDADISSTATTLVLSGLSGGVGQPFIRIYGFARIGSEVVRLSAAVSNSPAGKTTVTLFADGRGYWGTTAVAHTAGEIVYLEPLSDSQPFAGHTYPNIALNALALGADVDTAWGTGRAAYGLMLATGTGLDDRAQDTRFNLIPAEGPRGVTAMVRGGGVTLKYGAPDLGACRYRVAVDFSDSDDQGDSLDGGGAPSRIVRVELAAGAYRYRVSCGAGREYGQITVP